MRLPEIMSFKTANDYETLLTKIFSADQFRVECDVRDHDTTKYENLQRERESSSADLN